jgi:uncharacterized protein YdaU (DUF1376 family)
MNFYPFHIGDYISHTSHLTDEEDLAYRRMIDLYYMTEQPFNDSSTIARRIRSSVETVESILHEFFEFCDDDCWHSKRVDEEIAKYHSRLNQASKAGKASAEARFNKRSTSVQPTKNQEPLTNNHIKTTAPKLATPDGVSVDLWNDFLVYRKRLKAPVTDRVLARLIKEAELAKMPLDQVLETIIFKGWRSFEASWITQAAQKAKELPLGTNEQIEAAYRQELGKDPALARFNSYFDMRNFIIEHREKRKVA